MTVTVADPDAADKVYESCIHFLRERTRDYGQFPLVLDENMNYGFRRNLWGWKPLGIASCAIGLLASLGRLGWEIYRAHEVSVIPAVAAVVIGLMLAVWTLAVNPAWIKLAADAYAQRLLAACENL